MHDRYESFLRLYTTAEQSLFTFIRSAGFGLNDAEDILQDAALALWKNFPTYDAARPFIGWALGVTRNHINKQRRYARVRKKMIIDSNVVESISCHVEATLGAYASEFAEEKEYLAECLEQLSEKFRALLRMRYQERLSLKVIAQKTRKSYAATNMLLSRIRVKLHECVSTSMGGNRP